ncbi:potassium channel family protein [Pararhodobacter sp. SW119]|uniref:potassium channel family protein n=1 Tax=Pararhodobacter sp. SW119 TaxID=2780075 RepID=UPI001AE09EA8|nr:potassium channel family protein [Pararhodobacter sp. SW119]
MALKTRIRELYFGRSVGAARFRYALIGLDLVTIAFFVATAPLEATPAINVAEAVIGTLILFDLIARIWTAPDRRRLLRQVYTLADVIVILSLIAEPLIGANLAFLKVLRSLRLIHSYQVLGDLRRDVALFREYEPAIVAAVNLLVFILVSTSLVFVVHFDAEPGYGAYVDALYFTVATLTTTGYGDIVMESSGGRILSVVMMVVGVALFFRLARAIFVPAKVAHRCTNCGLDRHDPDAVHCKHCGETVKIATHGVN